MLVNDFSQGLNMNLIVTMNTTQIRNSYYNKRIARLLHVTYVKTSGPHCAMAVKSLGEKSLAGLTA
jgi:hypothetical protein